MGRQVAAEGGPQVKAREIVEKLELREYVTAYEIHFFADENPLPEECQRLVGDLSHTGFSYGPLVTLTSQTGQAPCATYQSFQG